MSQAPAFSKRGTANFQNHMSEFNPVCTPLRMDKAFLSYQNTQREQHPSTLVQIKENTEIQTEIKNVLITDF
jgi:hypothetical protein